MNLAARVVSRAAGAGISAMLLSALLVAASAQMAGAAGVVGTGTAASCTDAALNIALAGGGLVTFNCSPAAVTIDISTGTGTKFIAADTTIDGGSLITISCGGSAPLFVANARLAISNLTFTACDSGDVDGAVITANGPLTVTNSTFSGNRTNGSGGVIDSGGPLTVTDSTFANNSAGYSGGAILSGGALTVTNSTFFGNSAVVGGAIGNEGQLTLTNSTFTGNSGSTGAAIYNYGNAGGAVTVTNTIFANSPAGGNCAGGAIGDGGHNIDDDTTCGFSESSLTNANPMLDPAGLRNNGGPTQTIALCAGAGMPSAGCTAASPAVDAGDEAVCAAPPVNNLDQRGYTRGATHCSIGAYEYNAESLSATATSSANSPTPTPTPMPPPPTAIGQLCTGDCTGDGEVTVNTLILLVNIALGNAQPSACPNGVPSGENVDISLIIQAVNNALCGCGVACPTPVPTYTRTEAATPTSTPTCTPTATRTLLPPTATPTAPAIGQVLFKEGWEKSAVQRYGPQFSILNGDTGTWQNGSGCFATTSANYAQVIVEAGSHRLQLHSARNAGCDDDSQFVEPLVLTTPVGPRDLNLPVDQYMFLSFYETGALVDPDPCDAVAVSVLFDQGDTLTYVLQHGSQWDTSPSSCSYGNIALQNPILLPTDQVSYVRNIADDAASIGVFPDHAHYIELRVNSHGDATFDNITFFRASGAPPLPTPTPTPKPGTCVRVQQGTWCLHFPGLDMDGPLSQSGCTLKFDSTFTGPLVGNSWQAGLLGETFAGTFIGNPATSFEGSIESGGQSYDVTGNVGACSG